MAEPKAVGFAQWGLGGQDQRSLPYSHCRLWMKFCGFHGSKKIHACSRKNRFLMDMGLRNVKKVEK